MKLHSVHHAEVEGLHTAQQAEVERLCSLHLVEIEHNDSLYEAEKVRVLSKLQASYNTKLLGLYEEQYELGYSVGYAEAERIAHGDQDPSSEDSPEPTRNKILQSRAT